MKKLKVIVLQGLPASGKSTFARKVCKSNPENWVKICRDDIRSSLGTYWVPSRENLISEIEGYSVMQALSSGYNVLIDATNLNSKIINKWHGMVLNFPNVELEFKEFKISLNKAIWRDFKRGLFGGRRVGRKVIKGFYKRYYEA